MLCKLSHLKSEALVPYETTSERLLSYGHKLKPLSKENKEIANFLRPINTAEYKIGAYNIFILQYEMFTNPDLTKRYQELFYGIKMDIIDIETKIVYGIIRTNCYTFGDGSGDHLYLIPKI